MTPEAAVQRLLSSKPSIRRYQKLERDVTQLLQIRSSGNGPVDLLQWEKGQDFRNSIIAKTSHIVYNCNCFTGVSSR